MSDEDIPSVVSMQEPPYFYVREKASAAAHHWDYLNDRADEALCGHGYCDPITLGEVPRPKAVCRACQARLPQYHAVWWSERARTAYSELEELRAKYNKLEEHSNNQRIHLSVLQKKMQDLNRGGHDPNSHVIQRPGQKKSAPAKSSRNKPTREDKKRQPPRQLVSPFARQLGIPSVSRAQLEAEKKAKSSKPLLGFEPDPKTLQKLRTPERKSSKSAAEKASDDAARERMRSYKPNTWRLGRSPGSYR
ncbi:hypothetical protein [Mycobacterium sp. IS-1742]|uniref:hypothetical protein n=1 Tax=Mycobacterium sp. IS-1742 TaxID=1772285 RepID=UPI0012F8B381|nr:hypothetical protein [Mycobacterium sp. IS-1742]